MVGSSSNQAPQSSAVETAWSVLETVVDPEIPVINIAELGVLREISVRAGVLHVVITPTYSGCPAMQTIEADIVTALAAADMRDVTIETRLAPAWTTDWLSDAAREKLRDYGIAPPHASCARSRANATSAIACPQCGSDKTERISEFGSTACKALYRCTDCLEPFDYFKCI